MFFHIFRHIKTDKSIGGIEEIFRKTLYKFSLSHAGGTDEEHIALLDLNAIIVLGLVLLLQNPLVMVVNGNGQRDLRRVLTDGDAKPSAPTMGLKP